MLGGAKAAAPASPVKVPEILTIDEVVAQEESKRSQKEKGKLDLNKVQRLNHLSNIEESKDNLFEYEDISDSDSDDAPPPPPPKGPPSFLKDKLKLNIPSSKLKQPEK